MVPGRQAAIKQSQRQSNVGDTGIPQIICRQMFARYCKSSGLMTTALEMPDVQALAG